MMTLRTLRASAVLLTVLAFPATAAVHQWTNSGPEEAQVLAIGVSPRNSSLVIAATTQNALGEADIDGIGFSGEFRGESWKRLKSQRGVTHVFFVPGQKGTIYGLGARTLSKSTDGGQTWTELWSTGAFDLATDPARPETIYLAGKGVARNSGREGWVGNARQRARQRICWSPLKHAGFTQHRTSELDGRGFIRRTDQHTFPK